MGESKIDSRIIDPIVIGTTGNPAVPVNLQVVGSQERLIATGPIPASVFPDDCAFREGALADGAEFTVEQLSGDDRADLCCQ